MEERNCQAGRGAGGLPECLIVGDIETNCWIYPLPDRDGSCALFDPGDEAPRIIAFLKEKNLVPRYILLTHGHFDHLAALPELLAAFTPAASQTAPAEPAVPGKIEKPLVALHRDDAEYLGSGAYPRHRDCMLAAGGSEAYVRRLWKPMPGADILLSGGGTIGPFTVLHLPGHTPGSAAYYNAENGILFSGDTLFRAGRGRTDLPGGDENKLRQSLARLFTLEGGVTVCPGHGPATTIENEIAIYQFE